MGFEYTLTLSAAQAASDAGDLRRVLSCLEQTIALEMYVVEKGPT